MTDPESQPDPRPLSEKQRREQDAKKVEKAEKASRERFEKAMNELREGAYRFSSKARGQASIIIEELIDPEGDAVAVMAEVEGDAGAMALSMPLDLITFDTWLFGQVGDKEELDLKDEGHWEIWFNFGAWIGETLRRRHGGHWMLLGDDPHTWRIGFSKILLEIAPFQFAEQLIRLGSGALRKMVSEIERLRELHDEQKKKDGGQALDRFTSQHYIRMHTVPLGQWMALDWATLWRLWTKAATKDLIKEIRKAAARLGPSNQGVVDRIVEALGKADPEKPLGPQTNDRGLFEAIAQIIGLRRATAPIAIDILERVVLPALHVGVPDAFPPLDEDDIASLRRGIELFAFYVDVVPHKYRADDEGFLGSVSHADLSTPYADRTNLEIGKGDWVVVNPRHFVEMLGEFDAKKLLDTYDAFVAYVSANPEAPRRRDDGRMLAETAARALTDFKACVAVAVKEQGALVFRLLPPPG